MANTTFQGPVISKKGFYNTGPANVIDADSSTSLTVATHAGRIVHNDAAGAVTYTLPAVNATADSGVSGPGPGDQRLLFPDGGVEVRCIGGLRCGVGGDLSRRGWGASSSRT